MPTITVSLRCQPLNGSPSSLRTGSPAAAVIAGCATAADGPLAGGDGESCTCPPVTCHMTCLRWSTKVDATGASQRPGSGVSGLLRRMARCRPRRASRPRSCRQRRRERARCGRGGGARVNATGPGRPPTSSPRGDPSGDADRCWQAFRRHLNLRPCAARHCATRWRRKPIPLGPSQTPPGEAGAARPGERRERAESSPENAGTDRHRQTVRFALRDRLRDETGRQAH